MGWFLKRVDWNDNTTSSLLRACLRPLTSAATARSSTAQRLWKDHFTDQTSKHAHPEAPYLKHKLPKESTWIDGCYNPSWVKDTLKMETANKCMHSPIAQQLREHGSWHILTLEEAIASLERMPHPPSVQNLTYILPKCRKHKNRAYALRLHAYLRKSGLEAHKSLGNYLVPMLVEVGSMCDAQQVFDRLVDRNEHSWTSLITGYVENGQLQHAFVLYQKMQEDSVPPSGHTFVALLKGCALLKDTERGRELHAQIARKGLLERDRFVGNTLVDMYAKCGVLAKAEEVFDKLPGRDEVSWTALIAGYAEHGLGQEALNCFQQMQLEGISPNAVTFVCSLKACGSIRAIDKGREIHAQITEKELSERNIFVGNALIDMYAKCGLLAKAQELFDKLPARDAVSWNALMTAYAEDGLGQEALNCFEQMQLEGLSPSLVTFVCSLKACSGIGAIEKGQEIHAQIVEKGSLERDPFVGNTLVDMYAKCGFLAKAQEIFDKLPVQDAVSWNAIIAGYAEHGLGQEALNCFKQMQLEGVFPNSITFICSLKACGNIGDIGKGQELHSQIATNRLLEKDPFVGNTLVDMYAKCGLLAKAQEVFDKLPARGAVSWTALIVGYAKHGLGQDALKCFEQMQLEGVSPDAVSWNALIAGYAHLGESDNVFLMLDRMRSENIKPDGFTFLGILTVCNHTGLVEKGQTYFEAMSKDYGITPTIEHHNCMVDLLGRAGQLDKAVVMIKTMPFDPNLVLWHTMLGACWKWGNVELGKWAFEHAVGLDKKDAAAYVFMSNIYADAHMQEDAKRIEVMRLKEQAWKTPRQSWWTDVGGVVC